MRKLFSRREFVLLVAIIIISVIHNNLIDF